MKIRFDPEANAVYILIREITFGDIGGTSVADNGVILDKDAKGDVRGYEFLCVKENGLPLDGIPSSVASHVVKFVESGALSSSIPVEAVY